jgi:hypothetical protein
VGPFYASVFDEGSGGMLDPVRFGEAKMLVDVLANLRLNNRQCIANARAKPIEANKNQAVDGAEGLFLRSGSTASALCFRDLFVAAAD